MIVVVFEYFIMIPSVFISIVHFYVLWASLP